LKSTSQKNPQLSQTTNIVTQIFDLHFYLNSNFVYTPNKCYHSEDTEKNNWTKKKIIFVYSHQMITFGPNIFMNAIVITERANVYSQIASV